MKSICAQQLASKFIIVLVLRRSPPRRFLLSQATMYHECIYRLRRMYSYVLLLDVDEFLWINPKKVAAVMPFWVCGKDI